MRLGRTEFRVRAPGAVSARAPSVFHPRSGVARGLGFVALAALALIPLLAVSQTGQQGTPPPGGPDSAAIASPAAGDSIFHVTGDHLEGRRTDEGEVVVLTGNVVVTQGTLRARGDRGEYRKAEETVTLDGNVLVTDREMRLRSHSARYERLARRLIAEGDVFLTDGSVEARAPHGEYWRDDDRAVLSRGCVYREANREIRAETMTYLRATKELIAENSVIVIDTEQHVRVEGRYARWKTDEDRGFVTGRPRLVSLPDTTAVTPPEPSPAPSEPAPAEKPYEVISDTLVVNRATKELTARGNVAFRQGDTEGTGEEAVFHQEDQRTRLTGNPVIRQGGSEIRGGEVIMTREKGEIDQILVKDGASATYVAPDSLHGRDVPPSTIAGDEMTLDVTGGELNRMVVTNHAHVRYYPPPGEGGKGEWNETEGDTIRLGFEGSRLTRVEVRGSASGVHHMAPEDTTAAAPVEEPGGHVGAIEKPDSSSYSGEAIDYDIASHDIALHGKSEVDYGDVKLKAGDIVFNSSSQELRARSYPVLFDGSQKMLGRMMTYNLGERRGSIYGGVAGYEKGFYEGEVIRKIDEDVLYIEKGRYTSCDRAKPHYAFRSRRMKVYIGDRVIAKPLVLYIGNVPVLPLPFFLFPIAGDRRSGLLIPDVEFGASQRAGRFIRHFGYYWVPNDYADVKVWADYFENQHYVGYVETRYKKIYLLEGNVRASYQRELTRAGRRWDLSAYHRHEINENLSLTGRANFVSDRTYRQDIISADRLNRELRSDLSLAKRWESANLNMAVDRRENLDTGTISTTLPQVSASLLRRPFFGGRTRSTAAGAPWYRTFYYDTSGELRNQSSRAPGVDTDARSASGSFNLSSQLTFGAPKLSYRTRADEVTVSTSSAGIPTQAFDNVLTVGGSPRIHGWLELSPTGTIQETWFNRGAGGQPGGWRRTWDARATSRANFYGTFFPRWGNLVGVRHVMSPQIGFTYQPAFSQYTGRFQSVGGVGAPSYPGRRIVDLGLVNNLHLKVRRGEKTENLNNVASLQFNTTYDFRWRDQLGRESGWSPLRSGLTVQPGRGTDLRLTTVHTLPDVILDNLSATASWTLTGSRISERRAPSSPAPQSDAPGPDWYLDPLPPLPAGAVLDRPWTLSLSQRYTHVRGLEDAFWFEGNVETNLFTQWRIAYTTRIDLRQRDVVAQEWSLYRDLHCWEARFTRSFSNEEWRYFFRINIKAHPEIHAERGERALAP